MNLENLFSSFFMIKSFYFQICGWLVSKPENFLIPSQWIYLFLLWGRSCALNYLGFTKTSTSCLPVILFHGALAVCLSACKLACLEWPVWSWFIIVCITHWIQWVIHTIINHDHTGHSRHANLHADRQTARAPWKSITGRQLVLVLVNPR